MFNKMVLIPERDYNNFLHPSLSLTKNLSEQIFDIQNRNIPADIKNLRESELISKLNTFRTPTPSSGLTREQIINRIPDRLQNRAKIVLDTVGESWTPSGELKIGGVSIPNSNIVDLVRRSIDEGNEPEVPAFRIFQDLLTKNNIALPFLNKETDEPTDKAVKKDNKKGKKPKIDTSPRSTRSTRKRTQKGKAFQRMLPGQRLLELR